jgi:propanediol utilization protein
MTTVATAWNDRHFDPGKYAQLRKAVSQPGQFIVRPDAVVFGNENRPVSCVGKLAHSILGGVDSTKAVAAGMKMKLGFHACHNSLKPLHRTGQSGTAGL